MGIELNIVENQITDILNIVINSMNYSVIEILEEGV